MSMSDRTLSTFEYRKRAGSIYMTVFSAIDPIAGRFRFLSG